MILDEIDEILEFQERIKSIRNNGYRYVFFKKTVFLKFFLKNKYDYLKYQIQYYINDFMMSIDVIYIKL